MSLAGCKCSMVSCWILFFFYVLLLISVTSKVVMFYFSGELRFLMWFIFIYLCFAYFWQVFSLFCDTRLWKVHYIVYLLLRMLQENCLLNVSSDYSQQTRSSLAQLTEKEVCFELVDSLIKYILTLETPGAILIFLDGWNIIFKLMKYLEQHPIFGMLSVSKVSLA